jgi:hypothetical protein
MIPRARLPHRRFAGGFFVAFVLSACVIPAVGGDYAKSSVDQLIDDLTQIDSQSPGINSAAIYEGFIADNSPGPFGGGVLGIAPPKVPPQMSELVRRGPLALRELIEHLDDRRPTKLEVGNKPPGTQVGVDAFMFMYFSDEYDPRMPHWFDLQESKKGPRPMEKDFHGRYTVKVGDICYVLIGQIVNRHLFAVRYQPSAGLVVNSPIEAPVLAEKVEGDWGNADAAMLKASLLTDVHGQSSKTYQQSGIHVQICESRAATVEAILPRHVRHA